MTDITQADRDAAASFFRNDDTPLSVKFTLGANPKPLLEAFAAHRIATQSAIAKMLDEMAGKEVTCERQLCLHAAAAKVRASI